ncbi:PKD domain-containing protein [Mucilaginibacter sp. dw_454]|uniref:gliding motility-associated C-terminal domain-containing protein n=1 Tax=Mucilaginibacter sp. dw_454 TaxID=2720079 RepID=UPI001BD5830F|nr:PKD domain-containing protein [Mucilaginibacter sp. dw_454]
MALICFYQKSYGQSLGDPIVHITFGSGVNPAGPALAADSGSTTYRFSNGISPEDGLYGIFNTTAGLNPNWRLTTDHTGDPNGYMMIVNADYDPGLFYTRKVDGLCGSTTYQFAAWIKNILGGTGGILPNVTFSIETMDGTLLDSASTGNIANDGLWKQYLFTFTTPMASQSIVLKMTNNAPGGGGNDMAIDDITFSPYGTPIAVESNQLANKSFCVGSPQMVTINTTTPLDHNFAQKLQRFDNGKWIDHSAASTTTSFSFLTPDTAGAYSYRVVKSDAGNINSSQCVVASNKLDITVYSLPIASFTVADTICQGDTSIFKDRSTAGGATGISWQWDFGDGQTSVIQNPHYLFTTAGDHIVKLTVTNSNGCSIDTVKTIHVVPQVIAAFNYSNPDCVDQTITFTDNSTSAEANIISRQWDFGDSTYKTFTNNSPFQHTYDKTGTFQVKLTLNTDKGCSAILTKTVEVHAVPKVNFILPEVCLADSYAQFTDSTFVADNMPMTYLWDFGDSNASVANNTSTAQNPKHIYTEAKQYQVKLTVTSSAGCQQTVIKPFTVNGSIPKAVFNVLNATSLCSNRAVYFVNQSTVDFGSTTRVVWDYGDGSKKDTDENPYKGKLYYHKYAETHLPNAAENHTVTMLAYSGQSCVSPTDTMITILAVPTLTFNAPDSVCINFGTVQFAAQEGTSISGTGTYYGTGVSPSGLFDPVKAGIGIFDIKYIYEAGTGCADTIVHRIKVNPIGTVDAGPDVTILAGGATTLHATATGDNITYLWSPAIGLSSTTIPNPVVNAENDMTYTLTVTNKYGCSVTDQVNVKVLQAPVVPNTFTPNGDGINDTWAIKYLETYVGATVDVFNRNGQKVYTSVNYPVTGWDGSFRGQGLPVGVYYYIIDPKHGRRPISGYVTIVR